ncbi:HIT family protein [uncultured Streptococcus sp.]|uniref:HIT family protein n=1 Tax=uncultured Streptococcus sp. TaxID=83427 RepID=UPI002664EF4D|nr:HIT family protein [uncultured Streptococcus sp.]
MMQDDCLFCQIVAKKEKVAIIYEDESVLAFLDIAQVTPGHALIIPKSHVKNLLTMNGKTASQLFQVIPDIARNLKEKTGAQGINLIMNNEAIANQVIFHAHVHLIPRYRGDGVEIASKKHPTPLSELMNFAETIKNFS